MRDVSGFRAVGDPSGSSRGHHKDSCGSYPSIVKSNAAVPNDATLHAWWGIYAFLREVLKPDQPEVELRSSYLLPLIRALPGKQPLITDFIKSAGHSGCAPRRVLETRSHVASCGSSFERAPTGAMRSTTVSAGSASRLVAAALRARMARR